MSDSNDYSNDWEDEREDAAQDGGDHREESLDENQDREDEREVARSEETDETEEDFVQEDDDDVETEGDPSEEDIDTEGDPSEETADESVQDATAVSEISHLSQRLRREMEEGYEEETPEPKRRRIDISGGEESDGESGVQVGEDACTLNGRQSRETGSELRNGATNLSDSSSSEGSEVGDDSEDAIIVSDDDYESDGSRVVDTVTLSTRSSSSSSSSSGSSDEYPIELLSDEGEEDLSQDLSEEYSEDISEEMGESLDDELDDQQEDEYVEEQYDCDDERDEYEEMSYEPSDLQEARSPSEERSDYSDQADESDSESAGLFRDEPAVPVKSNPSITLQPLPVGFDNPVARRRQEMMRLTTNREMKPSRDNISVFRQPWHINVDTKASTVHRLAGNGQRTYGQSRPRRLEGVKSECTKEFLETRKKGSDRKVCTQSANELREGRSESSSVSDCASSTSSRSNDVPMFEESIAADKDKKQEQYEHRVNFYSHFEG